jgi:hypothetical protein
VVIQAKDDFHGLQVRLTGQMSENGERLAIRKTGGVVIGCLDGARCGAKPWQGKNFEPQIRLRQGYGGQVDADSRR